MRDECLSGEQERRCVEGLHCLTCGFNPDVAEKRKTAIHGQRKPKPPRMVSFDDVLTAAKERLDYAEKRLDEEARNGEDYDIRYWATYRDGAKSVVSALEELGGGGNG